MIMKKCRSVYGLAIFVLAFFAVGQAWAASTNGIWTLNNAGFWSAPANWYTGAIADGPGATGSFTNTITASRIITIDTTARTLGTLNLGAGGSGVGAFTIAAGTGLRLTLNNSGANAQVNVSGASNKSDTISSPLALADSLDIANASASKVLTISGTITSVVASAKTISNIGSGTGGVLISGAIGNGLGLVGVVQNSASSLLSLSASNTYANGLIIKAGTVSGSGNNNHYVFGANTNVITLGDSTGSQDANLNGYVATYQQPIVVAAGNSGTASITNTGTATFTGPVTLNNHDLKVAASASSIELKGGITGTGSLVLSAPLNGNITLSTTAINPAGTITNSGAGTGTSTISGGVGTNVTAITEASTGSALTVSGSLAVNSGGTTLANNNSGGVKLLTVTGGVKGTGDLVLKNNSAIAAGITLVTTAITNSGQIVNSGTGSGNTLLNAVVGANVTRLVQNSTNSPLSLQGAYSGSGGLFIKAGTVNVLAAPALGSGLVTLGDTNGAANVYLVGAGQVTFTNPVAVASNNTGVASISSSIAATFSGLVTLYSHDLLLSAPLARCTLSGGVAGFGNLVITNEGAGNAQCTLLPVNHTGTIVNGGSGAATTTISGGVGSNVTSIIENSANSPLTIDGAPVKFVVNGSGTTLANNSSGSAALSVLIDVEGRGDLILCNNSAIANGISVLNRSVMNVGQVVNSGTGSGNTWISSVIGPNVTRLVQASATSPLVLSGANTFSGETVIESGLLQVSNASGSATGTGAVNVKSGARLGGSGTITGTVTNYDGGTLSAGVDGTAGGTLTVGNLTWNGGSTINCEISSIANDDFGAGVDYDRIVVANTLTAVPGGKKLTIRMNSLHQTLPFQANRNYSLKVLSYGDAVNLDLADVSLDTSDFQVDGTWVVTNVNKSLYVVCMGNTSPTKNYWVGSGNWSTATNWSLGHAPLAGEDVEFDFRGPEGCTADVVNADLGTFTFSAGYTGTVTCLTKYPGQGSFTNLSIAGDCAINGGILTHLTNSGGEAEADRLALSVGGNLTVGPGGAINVDQKGFDIGKGPATGGAGSANSGASHGGLAGMGSASIAIKPTCGALAYPVNLGSGASARGGGAVFLNVTGTTRVDGVISAKGSCVLYTGSAGGSVLIQTAAMEGTGVIDAAGGIGGATSSAGGGGGGRVAVLLTDSATIGSVTMRAYGGSGYSFRAGSGTIYLQTTGQAAGTGTLIVDGGNLTDFNPVSACTMVDNFNLNQLAGVIIRNRGILGVNTNTTLDFGVAKIQGDGASVVANWRTALAAPAGATIALRGTNGVTFPNPFVISNFSLCLDVPVSVEGNWVVASNGSLSHSGNYNPLPGSEDYRLNLDLTGNLTVEAGGAVEASTKGYYSAKGPAAGMNGQGMPGAGHGGRGGQAAVRTPSNSYGSVREPQTLGSGGGQYTGAAVQRPGGGSIELLVRGTTTVYGAISVRTAIPVESRCAGAAGGSIYLKTRYLQGAGSIDAQGDPSGSDNSSPGGGGRIAVLLTESESFGDVTFSAAGCPPGSQSYASGAGTLYRERASEAGRGTLIIDNTDRAAVLTNSLTQLPSPAYAPAGELTPVTLTVTNRTHVELTSNLTMKNLYLYPNSILYLKGYTLTLNSAYHEDWGNVSQVVYEGGQILWVPPSGGSLIIIR